MPGKSRHQKGKRIAQSRKAMLRPTGQTQETVQSPEAVAAPAMAAPIKRTASGQLIPQYPYVSSEVRLFGLLGAIILAILIILTLILG